MTKDILVDNTVAKNFCNPLDPHYKVFIEWLFTTGHLVVSQRLLVEYYTSVAASPSETSMPAIINHLISGGRFRKITKAELEAFRFSKKTKRSLRSNKKDHDNIKAVMLSERKFALSHDNNFRYDINHFPGYAARAERRPEDIPYQ